MVIRKLKNLILIFISIVMLTISVSADNLYPNIDSRWYNGFYFRDNGSIKYGLSVTVDCINMNSNWTNRLDEALESWESAVGCYFKYSISSTDTNVEIIGISEIPSWFVGDYAVTQLRDTYGVWTFEFDTATSNDFYRWFNFARIYINKNYDGILKLSANNKQKVLAHETGHVLQLGHPSDTTANSVMHQGKIGGTTTKEPSAKDASDLITMYN